MGAYNSLLSMGVDRAATPNLDRLARAGTLFTDFHVSASRSQITLGVVDDHVGAFFSPSTCITPR